MMTSSFGNHTRGEWNYVDKKAFRQICTLYRVEHKGYFVMLCYVSAAFEFFVNEWDSYAYMFLLPLYWHQGIEQMAKYQRFNQ